MPLPQRGGRHGPSAQHRTRLAAAEEREERGGGTPARPPLSLSLSAPLSLRPRLHHRGPHHSPLVSEALAGRCACRCRCVVATSCACSLARSASPRRPPLLVAVCHGSSLHGHSEETAHLAGAGRQPGSQAGRQAGTQQGREMKASSGRGESSESGTIPCPALAHCRCIPPQPVEGLRECLK